MSGLALPSGVAEPPPEASVRPSPTRSGDRKGDAQATERPEPPGDGRRVPTAGRCASTARMARTATWPEQSPAVRPGSDGRAEADQPLTLGVGRISYQAFDVGSTDSRGVECLALGGTQQVGLSR
jgi:hypothetical protein